MSEKIPSLTDENWASKPELGTIEKVLEYMSGDELKKVNAVAHIPSGTVIETLEEEFAETDGDQVTINSKGYNRALWKVVFGINDRILDDIMNNKSANLRTQMILFANEACGLALSDDEIEDQKN